MITAFRELKALIATNWENRKITWSLAKMDLKQDYSGSALGVAWAFVKPLVYVSVFWFAIQIGLRGDKHVAGYPKLLWLIPGSFAWFYISTGFIKCGKSLIKNRHLVTKVVFPVGTIPLVPVIAEFLVHVVLMVLVFAIFALFGYLPDMYALQLPYYLLCAFLLTAVIATLVSALSAIARDVSYLMPSVNQALFWLSPILWPVANVHGWMEKIVKLNPVAYIVEGYRNAFIYHHWFWHDWRWMLYFWGVLLLLALVTAYIWSRLKNDFADVL